MNKKEFKKNMQQGLGRCAIVLKSSKNIDKYKDIVLWGCLHNLSYDTQCEGTRADYVYRLTKYFNDENYFLMPTIEKFDKLSPQSDWEFHHFSELLSRFAKDGNKVAREALLRKYELLLNILIKKRRFNKYDYERDNFEEVAIELLNASEWDFILKVLSDFGRIIKESPHYECEDFEWLLFHLEHNLGRKKLITILKRESKKSENIRCYYESYLDMIYQPHNDNDSSENKAKGYDNITNENDSNDKIDPAKEDYTAERIHEERIKLANEIIDLVDLDTKAYMILKYASREESFPFPHETLIEYSKSTYENLRNAAFMALTNCKSDAVKEYAISLLKEEKYHSYAVEMLLNNYSPSIKKLLLSELYKVKVDYKETYPWHEIDFRILDRNDHDRKLPKEFYIYIYNTTLCSCCRERAIRKLSRIRGLTPEIIDECRYDSNSDIVDFINKRFRNS